MNSFLLYYFNLKKKKTTGNFIEKRTKDRKEKRETEASKMTINIKFIMFVKYKQFI